LGSAAIEKGEHERGSWPCPCCGARVIDSPGTHEICRVCGWEDDPAQSADPAYAGGANRMSLNQSKKEWAERSPGL
jgi:hypothetical protein